MADYQNLISTLRNSTILKAVREAEKKCGVTIYLVGGFLRDFVSCVDICDMDLAVDGPPEPVAGGAATLLDGKFFPLGTGAETCYRLICKKNGKAFEIDFTALKGKDIFADLKKRDFTINAMALSIRDLFEEEVPQLIDPLGGEDDLRKNFLRPVSFESLDEDPLRILRGFRFAAAYTLHMDEGFLSYTSKNSNNLLRVSGERIRDELFKLLSCKKALQYLKAMSDLYLLDVIFPEMASARGMEQGIHHRFNILEHSLKTVDYLEEIISSMGTHMGQFRDAVERHLDIVVEYGIDRANLLKLTSFLHDSGKPSTLKVEGGKISFYGHEEEGAIINKKIACRLKLGKKARQIIQNVTMNHMRVLHLSKADRLSKRAIDRFVRDCGDETIEVLVLALADTLATRDQRDVDFTDVEGVVSVIAERYFELQNKPIMPLLNGDDVMKYAGIVEGPEVGFLLEDLKEEQLAGNIVGRLDAIKWLENRVIN